MTAANLKITETEPVTLIKDFGTFVKYLEEENPSLTRKGQLLTKKTLYKIDQLLSNPDLENTPETPKIFYPYLNLFYHLILKGGLFVKTKKLYLNKTGRLTDYEQLNSVEKYFFLLETFWVDANWEGLLDERASVFPIPDSQSIVHYLARTPAGKVIPVERLKLGWMTYLNLHYLLQYFALFGLVQITFESEGVRFFKKRKIYRVASVTVTDLGNTLFPVLYRERNLEKWNIQHIQGQREELTISPGLEEGQNETEPFFRPFQKLFKDLQRTLPRKESTKSTFTFKVSIRKNCWRTIVTSSEHTLEDLHNTIQDAFEFDSDHLYAFFTDGIPWSCNRILSPYDDEGPFSDKITIGELGLLPGQQILYIFDFGCEWRFKLEVLEKKDEPGPLSPVIRERKGKSPEQYPEWE